MTLLRSHQVTMETFRLFPYEIKKNTSEILFCLIQFTQQTITYIICSSAVFVHARDFVLKL